jgi:transcriptional regulator with XRE-family HTH domain
MKPTINPTDTLLKGKDLFRTAFGDTLRTWRRRHGKFKQMALSRKAGLPDYAVGSLERGSRTVVLEETIRICEVLEVDLEDFLMDVQKRALQPLVESLRAEAGTSDEERKAVALVSERAEDLIVSLAELARRKQGPTGR